MKFSLKLALIGVLLLAAVVNCQKKKKKGPKATFNKCIEELPTNSPKYPHQMTVANGATICGATWISEDIVLTAGHCVVDKNNKKVNANVLSVQTGVRERGTLGLFASAGEARTVKEIALHKGFKKVGAYYTNDIAILKLTPNTNLFGSNLQKKMEGKFAVLPEGKDAPTKGTEVGFLTPNKLLEMKSGKLWERAITVMDKAECAKAEEMSDAKADVEAGKTICGQESCPLQDKSCERMTGGGLLCSGSGDQDVLCGIQTVHNCDDEGKLPQAYLNVAEYKAWIDEKMEELAQ